MVFFSKLTVSMLLYNNIERKSAIKLVQVKQVPKRLIVFTDNNNAAFLDPLKRSLKKTAVQQREERRYHITTLNRLS